MNVTIFSSNQPRHLNLVKLFSQVFDEVFFISEANTVFPGQIEDHFRKSDIMKKYMDNVLKSEKKIFGEISFIPSNVKSLIIKNGDLNKLTRFQLEKAINSDFYIVFGASYIKGWLIDFLITKKALNIHMGLSPYYRGSSCNFWALYDNKPEYVGATIHLLNKGLDSGDILFHCIPRLKEDDNSFDFAMRSVLIAQTGILNFIKNGSILNLKSFRQDKAKELRYSKNSDFTDKVASEFLKRNIKLDSRVFIYPTLLNPVFG